MRTPAPVPALPSQLVTFKSRERTAALACSRPRNNIPARPPAPGCVHGHWKSDERERNGRAISAYLEGLRERAPSLARTHAHYTHTHTHYTHIYTHTALARVNAYRRNPTIRNSPVSSERRPSRSSFVGANSDITREITRNIFARRRYSPHTRLSCVTLAFRGKPRIEIAALSAETISLFIERETSSLVKSCTKIAITYTRALYMCVWARARARWR